MIGLPKPTNQNKPKSINISNVFLIHYFYMVGIKRRRTNGYKPKRAFHFKRPTAPRYTPPAIERKSFDTAVALGVGATGGLFIDSLCHVPQGTDDTERIGRKITITNVNLRLNAQKAQDATEAADVWRCIIYIDNQANKATAAVEDILTAAGTNTFRNLDNAKRFNVIYDKTENIASTVYDATNNLAEVKNRWFSTFHYSKEGIPITFTGAAGVIGEITEKNIGLLWINLSGKTSLNGICRIRYTDA